METARLSQMHAIDSLSIKSSSMTDPAEKAESSRSQANKSDQPPNLFSSGDSLLALTKKHNVCRNLESFCM